MNNFKYLQTPKIKPNLDVHFKPASLAILAFENAVKKVEGHVKATIGILRHHEQIAIFETVLFPETHEDFEENFFFLERLIKSLLWIKGGYEVFFKGPKKAGEHLQKVYQHGGHRDFDVRFMERIYEKPFRVHLLTEAEKLIAYEETEPIGRNLEGYRIGFDAGGSDRKVSAVINGEAIYSEEVVWHPKINSDPQYHIDGIKDSMLRAASKMPRVDAIGVSSAGVYIDNQAMVASLFRQVPDHLYNKHIKNIYLNIAKDMGDVPIEVANDGDVTALAGAMSLNDNQVLGIAMGTSQAVGYVDGDGHITGWLNELAFVPVDFYSGAEVDEWSLDFGVGVSYFSQDAVIKLAPEAGINLDSNLSPADRLKVVQDLVVQKHQGALDIFKTIGIYLGYALGFYERFYQMKHVLILGRVTSGVGGDLIIEWAKKVLETEFPQLAKTINLQLPDEKSRRVGQSIAAASLPKI